MKRSLGIRFAIAGRILDGRKTVGYDLVTYNSGLIPTSKEEVYMLASQGYITNAEVKRIKNDFRLEGRQGTNLSKIASRQIKKSDKLKIE